MDHKLKAEFIKAKSDVLDRMVLAGWLLKTASTKDRAICQPTAAGHAIIKALGEFVFFDGKPLTPLESSAFLRHRSKRGKPLVTVMPCIVAFLVAVLLVISGEASRGGWFSDTNFYVVEQKTPAGRFIDGWIVQGAQRMLTEFMCSSFIRRQSRSEMPAQGTAVTKIGPDLNMAHKFLSSEIATLSDEIHKGF